MMLEKRSRSVVVVKNDQIVGVVSITDIVMARQGRTKGETRQTLAGEVMSPGCTTVDIETPMSTAISTMMKRRIHRLVVTEQQGERDVPVGILSMSDMVRSLLAD